MMRQWQQVSALAAFCIFSGAAAAQQYPVKPIRAILSYPAGAGADIIVRRAAQDLGVRFGQPLVIDNRPGGNNVIAAEACAKAAPDGYTICSLNSGITTFNPLLMSNLPYDPEREIKPVVNMFYVIGGLYSSEAIRAKSIQELSSLAAARSGGMNFGTLGTGNATDIVRQWLGERWGTELTLVPYKGGNFIIAALASGEIDLTWIGVYNVAGQIKAGKIRVYAVDSSRRYRLLPNVPTFEEAGLGVSPVRAWIGIGAPAGIPDALVNRINSEFVRVFKEPRFSDFLDEQGVESVVGPPQEFAELLRVERAQAPAVVKRYNLPRQ